MELCFLGTGAGLPSKDRNVSCCVLNLVHERNAIWIFDCGEATQHQLLRSSLSLNKLEHIFISHLHGDHLFGLPGLLSSYASRGGLGPVTVYGPSGIKQFVEVTLQVSNTYIPYPLNIIEIDEGVIFEDEQFVVSALPLQHRVPSYGFRVVEKDRAGNLDAARLTALGIPPGPIYQQLKQGHTVTLATGQTINGEQFLLPAKKGRVVAIFGDTEEPILNAMILACQADVLVHEATMEKAAAASAKEYGHSTTEQVATLAKEAEVKQLIITHISARYSVEQGQMLLDECREIFANTLLATDFACFKV